MKLISSDFITVLFTGAFIVVWLIFFFIGLKKQRTTGSQQNEENLRTFEHSLTGLCDTATDLEYHNLPGNINYHDPYFPPELD